MASEDETKDRLRLLTEYACKLFGATAGEKHVLHFMCAAIDHETQSLIVSQCCGQGLAQIVVRIIVQRPDQEEFLGDVEAPPAGEKGN
jgi:hypothetical protein